MKVAIIGGGFAGLGAAYELAAHGIIPTIYEKSGTLGGLASSLAVQDVPIEHFYHHMFPTYYDFFEVAEKLSFKDKIYFVKGNSANLYDGTLYPFNSALDLLRFRPLSVFDRIRTGVVIAYLKFKRSPKSFEHVKASEWLPRAFGEKAYRILWEPLLLSKFGDRAKDIGMVWMWGRIYERPSRFGYFKGGFKIIVDALERFLQARGIIIHTNAEIVSLSKTGKTFILRTKDKEEIFDRVIVAAPPPSFSKIAGGLLPEKYLKNLSSYEYVGSICAILFLKRSLSPFYWISVDEPDCPFVAVVEQTNLTPKDTYHGLVPVYLSRYIDPKDSLYNLSEDELWQKFLPHISRINKEFDDSWIAEKHLFRAPFTQPIVPAGYDTTRPSFETPVQGLYWISMSHIYPWDRGTDHSFHAGRELAKQVLKNVHT